MTRSVAFLVAVDQFSDPSFSRLRFCHNDVAGMARVLANRDLCDFETVVVRNEKHDSILEKLERTLGELTSADKVLFYFAGHGKRSPRSGKLYLAATNTQAAALNATGIAIETVLQIMRESRCQQRVLILDCCHSGAIGVSFRGSDISDNLSDLAQSTGTYILTASTAIQTAEERESESGGTGHGLFTKYILEAIESGEAPTASDGETITVDGLYEFVYRKVVGNSLQQPQRFVLDGVGNMTVARSRGTKWNKRRAAARDKFLELLRAGAISDDQFTVVLKLTGRDWGNLGLDDRTVCGKVLEVLDGRMSATEFYSWVSERGDRRPDSEPVQRTAERPSSAPRSSRQIGSGSASDRSFMAFAMSSSYSMAKFAFKIGLWTWGILSILLTPLALTDETAPPPVRVLFPLIALLTLLALAYKFRYKWRWSRRFWKHADGTS